jgi:hypothetical protein
MITNTKSIQSTRLHSLSDAELSMISGGRMKLVTAVPPPPSPQPSGSGLSSQHPDYWWFYHG